MIAHSGLSEFYEPAVAEALGVETGTGAAAAALILEMGVEEHPK